VGAGVANLFNRQDLCEECLDAEIRHLSAIAQVHRNPTVIKFADHIEAGS
jgi:hypothetical protein